jgi:2-polyprenyl-3-methyl-5-hydroxy-6-metoxy-1,4-benzoquinol methylase
MNNINIHQPFNQDQFDLFKKGIYDNPEIDVFMNEQEDFALLFPYTQVNYKNYAPRVSKLNLDNYKKGLTVYKKRLNKLSKYINNNISQLIDIGSGAGQFLELIKDNFPEVELAAIEPDEKQENFYKEKLCIECYKDIDFLIKEKKQFEVISLFHVLEHIVEPAIFLSKIKEITNYRSKLVVEVPSLTDPLLSLYKSEAYINFYFQQQHPFIYSAESLKRLLEYNGFKTLEIINFQRYGLENHLNWLCKKKPGGDPLFQQIFYESDLKYVEELEKNGNSDSVIWIGSL